MEKLSVLKCLHPTLVRRSGMRHPGLPVGPGRWSCNVCELCCWRYSKEWERRSVREFNSSPAGYLPMKVDLTFDDQGLALAAPDFGYRVWRLFRMRLVKAYRARCPGALPLKFFGVPELGSLRGRLHIHALVFCVSRSVCETGYDVGPRGSLHERSEFGDLVKAAWGLGFVRVEVLRAVAGVRYCMKYVLKGRESVAVELKEHRRRSKAARARGVVLPSFRRGWWITYPRGRGGGLGAQFAEAVGQAQPPSALASGVLALPRSGGPRGPVVPLSRYERRRAVRAAGLDDEASKLKRAWLNPEPVEMAARVEAAGSFDALRASAGHRDDAEARLELHKVRGLKSRRR